MRTFTKKFVKIIMAMALVDIQLSYILAFLGREQIAEELGKVIVTEIIGVFFVYCVKAFFETREEKRMEMYEKEAKRNGDFTGFDDAEITEEGVKNESNTSDGN